MGHHMNSVTGSTQGKAEYINKRSICAGHAACEEISEGKHRSVAQVWSSITYNYRRNKCHLLALCAPYFEHLTPSLCAL